MTAREPHPDGGREGAGIGADIGLSGERLKDVRQGVESLLDPFGMVAPLAHAGRAPDAGLIWIKRQSAGVPIMS